MAANYEPILRFLRGYDLLKGGTADTALGLFHTWEPGEATLRVVSRDGERTELVQCFDGKRGLWQCVGMAQEVVRSSAQREVLEMLGGEVTTSPLAEYRGGNT